MKHAKLEDGHEGIAGKGAHLSNIEHYKDREKEHSIKTAAEELKWSSKKLLGKPDLFLDCFKELSYVTNHLQFYNVGKTVVLLFCFNLATHLGTASITLVYKKDIFESCLRFLN